MNPYPLALTLGRPLCWTVARGVTGTVRLTLTQAQRALLAPDRIVLIHSAHVGDPQAHRSLLAVCREAGITPPDRDTLSHDEWRGVAQIVRVIDSAQTVLHLRGLHVFEPAPFWGTPGPDHARLWLPSQETADSLLDEWQSQQSQRGAA